MDRLGPVRHVQRRRLALEQLEDRRVLSAILLSGHEQLLLELVNRTRNDPAAEAAQYRIDLNAGLDPGTITADAKQPLAPHQSLIVAAGLHAQDMLDNDYIAHDNLEGETPSDRAQDAGYPANVGENIAWWGTSGALDQTAQVFARHEALFRSETHRQNMLLPGYREVGTGVRFGDFLGFNAVTVAEEFGTRGGDRFITGVAYVDSVIVDNFYSVTEGLQGAAVTAVRDSDGMIFTTTTGPTGGYSLQVPSGNYSVTALGGQLLVPIVHDDIVISSANVKVDFVPSRAVTRPNTPADTTLTAAASSQIDVSWTDSAGEDGYKVYHNVGGVTTLIATMPANATSYRDKDLTPSTLYYYTIAAYNTAGSSFSPWQSAVTLAPPRPNVPGSVQLNPVAHNQVDVSWNDSTGEDGYKVWRNVDGVTSLIATLGADETEYSDTNAASTALRYYTIQAFNSGGSAYSPWQAVVVTVIATVRPNVPGSVMIDPVAHNQVDVSWADSTGEDGYKVYHNVGGATTLIATLPADATSYQDKNLSSSTLYYYTIEAFNGEGKAFSPWKAVVTPSMSPPTSPSPLSLADAAADRLEITWTNSSFEDGYRVYQYGDGGGVLIGSFAADVTSHSISGLQPQTGYWFSVEAFNSVRSVYVPWTRFTTLAASTSDPEEATLQKSGLASEPSAESSAGDLERLAVRVDAVFSRSWSLGSEHEELVENPESRGSAVEHAERLSTEERKDASETA
jgi:fibronectin type 3 domain-containing protein